MPREAGLTTDAPEKGIDSTRTTAAGDLRAVHVEAAKLLIELDRELGHAPDQRVIALASNDTSKPTASTTTPAVAKDAENTADEDSRAQQAPERAASSVGSSAPERENPTHAIRAAPRWVAPSEHRSPSELENPTERKNEIEPDSGLEQGDRRER